MRIAVVNNWVPFLRGGAEHLAEALTAKFIEYGHQATLIRLPFCWTPPQKILDSILACRCTCLDNIDRVVALKFPAYCVPHENKIVWLVHQFRQAYDQWGTEFQSIPDTPEGRRIRDVIVASDNSFLPESRAIYTNSRVTAERLQRFNKIGSTVLFPPLFTSSHLVPGEYGDYVFVPGRITLAKRQHLACEAMRYSKSGIRMIIAGPPETPGDAGRLREIVARHSLGDRVEIIPRFITEAEKAAYMANALACVYIPYDEDSYGYVTLEAAHACKATVTCTDSGGISILVMDDRTGCICEPDPKTLADTFDHLFHNRKEAERMGTAAREHMLSLKISWDHVIERLTA